jgi:hypothetical protein
MERGTVGAHVWPEARLGQKGGVARAEVRHVRRRERCLGRGTSRLRNGSRGEGRVLQDKRSVFLIEMRMTSEVGFF